MSDFVELSSSTVEKVYEKPGFKRQSLPKEKNIRLTLRLKIGLVFFGLFVTCLPGGIVIWTNQFFKNHLEIYHTIDSHNSSDNFCIQNGNHSVSLGQGIYFAHFSTIYEVKGETENCGIKIQYEKSARETQTYPFLKEGHNVGAKNAIFKFEFLFPIKVPDKLHLTVSLTNPDTCKRFFNCEKWNTSFIVERLNRAAMDCKSFNFCEI